MSVNLHQSQCNLELATIEGDITSGPEEGKLSWSGH